MAEQRYQAVMAVIGDGWSVSQVAEKIGAKTTCAERLSLDPPSLMALEI